MLGQHLRESLCDLGFASRRSPDAALRDCDLFPTDRNLHRTLGDKVGRDDLRVGFEATTACAAVAQRSRVAPDLHVVTLAQLAVQLRAVFVGQNDLALEPVQNLEEALLIKAALPDATDPTVSVGRIQEVNCLRRIELLQRLRIIAVEDSDSLQSFFELRQLFEQRRPDLFVLAILVKASHCAREARLATVHEPVKAFDVAGRFRVAQFDIARLVSDPVLAL